jgi:hypothetical protein
MRTIEKIVTVVMKNVLSVVNFFNRARVIKAFFFNEVLKFNSSSTLNKKTLSIQKHEI